MSWRLIFFGRFRMAFMYGTKLASTQDDIFARFLRERRTQPSDIDKLRNNPWISAARVLAPNNLVVRNYCLVDLLNDSHEHAKIILRTSEAICKKKKDRYLWREGYSYWIYTKYYLVEYCRHMDTRSDISVALRSLVANIDLTFVAFSYKREDGLLYPPPFGDLADIPLESVLQGQEPHSNIHTGFLSKSGLRYHTDPSPVGLNLHTPNHESTYLIVDDIPIKGCGSPFPWYRGYSQKYPNFGAELCDMLSLRRIISIITRFR